jgi:hypothetical protein
MDAGLSNPRSWFQLPIQLVFRASFKSKHSNQVSLQRNQTTLQLNFKET